MNPMLRRRQLAAYGALGMPLTALLLPLAIFLPPYYAQLSALTTGLVGALLFGARLWDLVTDLGVGWASDRTRSRFGRRRPWIVLGTPVLLVGGWYLFTPPDTATWVYLLGWSLVAYLGWSMIMMPYQTWGAELSTDYDERSRVTAAREIFAVVGTLVAIILPNLWMQQGGDTGDGLVALYVFLLASLPICLLVLLLGVDEPTRHGHAGLDLRGGLALMRNNRPFRRLLFAYLLNGFANALPAVLFVFFVEHRLEASQAEMGMALVVYFLSAVVGLPIWLRVGRHWSKHRLWCASMGWVSVVFAFAPLLGPGGLAGYLVICVLGGACLGVDQAIPASMQADVIDEDTAAGGGGRAGLYFGLWGLATKLAIALGVGIAFPVLDLAGFDAKINNDATALWTLALLYAVLPVAIKLCVIPVVWNFPLSRDRHAQLQARLQAAGTG